MNLRPKNIGEKTHQKNEIQVEFKKTKTTMRKI